MIRIGDNIISENTPPLIIAEIGINHCGSIDLAVKMVESAKRAGVKVVKHQTHIVEDEMSSKAKSVIPGNSDKAIYDIMSECALNENEELELKKFTEEIGLTFISTPFSRAAAERLKKMDLKAYKIGSGECNNLPLVDHIAAFKKPMIISTGMNDINSIKKTINIVEKHNVPYALMHTTNIYPTPNHLVRLGAMESMMRVFPNVPIGLSDHTISNHACFAATALGAQVLERHFTDKMNREGPDIICSMDEQSCADLIMGTQIIHSMLGGEKKAIKEEQVTIEFAFSTVVSIKGIKKGDLFSVENIWVKRPGQGIRAEFFDQILGKRANKDIAVDHHIKWSDIVK